MAKKRLSHWTRDKSKTSRYHSQIMEKIQEQENFIGRFSSTANNLLLLVSKNDPLPEGFVSEQLRKLREISDEIDWTSERLVDLYIQQSQSKVRDLVLRNLILVGILALLGFLLFQMLLERKRVEKISRSWSGCHPSLWGEI